MDTFGLFFGLMIIGHLLGDYLFQTEYEALNKAAKEFFNRALFSHCIKYTLCFIPIFMYLGINLWWLSFVFATHVFFDRRWPIIWWRKNINGNSEESIKATFWLTVMIDQIFHVLTLAVVALTC